MFRDEFKERYTTIPFAISVARRFKGGTEVITHQHREVEIISATDGEIDFYVDMQEYHVKKGDVLIIPPYALHRALVPGEATASYYCICFDVQLLCDEWLKKGWESQTLSVKRLIPGEESYSSQLQDYIEKAFISCKKNEQGWELDAVGNISLAFGLLKRNGNIFKSSDETGMDGFGKSVMTYIINNYHTAITSRDVADELYMNHSYFCRLFKKTFGSCFANYVLAYRLEKARLYLSGSEMPVTEVAFRVGFNDSSYFGKVFKARFGLSPLSYRKSKRK